jgi:NADH-quinone oxidoreductase subunit J
VTIDAVVFYVLAVLALASAILVIAQRNPTYSAFGLIVTLCSLSGIFGLLGSPFIAALQVIVYAGAIMVLFLFVIMLLNVQEEARPERETPTLYFVGLGLVTLLSLEVGYVLRRVTIAAPATFDASTASVARLLFSTVQPTYLYVFEATSILILAALVGAVVLAKKEL